MKKKAIVVVCIATVLLIAIASIIFFKKDGLPVIHCYEYSAAYDYALDCGYDTFIIYGTNQPDFNSLSSDFSYESTDKGLFISSYNGDSKIIYIPEEYDGKTVKGIKEGAIDMKKVTDIFIPVTTKFIEL